MKTKVYLLWMLARLVHLATAILVIGGLLQLASCATPVAVGPHHFGVGVYRVDSESVNPDVDYQQIEGVGVLVADGRLSLGYVDYQWVHARVEGRSYRARTPLVEFAVGEEAEKIGIEFLSSK
ncbi:MAG: hypothetical protein ACYSSO_08325 [Planctomycetota bacterium]|jgi:hypothetical protein